MAIFSTLRGKRGGRRESIFGSASSATDENGAAGAKGSTSSSSPYNRDATDVLGEAPSFSSRNRTPSESASLKNRQSSSNMLRIFGSGKRTTSNSGHDAPSHAPGSSSLSDVGHRSSQATARQESTFESSTSLVHQNGAGAGETAMGPRPSDLFAGKGVNWDQVKLSGPPVVPTDTKRNDELQTFLKARRQWVPTFKTDGTAVGDEKPVPKLEEVSFGGAPPAPSGLMTLKDLEASHNRKQQLLSDLPVTPLSNDAIVGGVAAAPAAGAAKPSLISRTSQSGSVRATADIPARNQSFRQSPFVASTSNSSNNTTTTTTTTTSASQVAGSSTLNRQTSIASSNTSGLTSPVRKPPPSAAAILSSAKANGNGSAHAAAPGSPAPASSAGANGAAGTVSAPPRKSSVALPTDDAPAGTTAAAPVAALAVPTTTTNKTAAADTTEASSASNLSAIRPSLDSTSGFQTPEARSEAAHVETAQTGEQTPKP
ncbi:hypothetical protein OC834_000364 [Tilletia horrida]|nr:hypothetical protein OC834_000364 [Tilletia horrida]